MDALAGPVEGGLRGFGGAPIGFIGLFASVYHDVLEDFLVEVPGPVPEVGQEIDGFPSVGGGSSCGWWVGGWVGGGRGGLVRMKMKNQELKQYRVPLACHWCAANRQ